MTLKQALKLKYLAKRPGKDGHDVWASRGGPVTGIRIIAGYTDPTVIRKPSKLDFTRTDWEPVAPWRHS